MRTIRSTLPAAALALALGLLLGCDTAEERAEAHYQRATALLEAGEVERAIVEFRNVFRLDGRHSRARLDFARLLRDRGNTREATAQFLRLVEEDRQHAEGHRELAALALETQDFETAERHAARAFALDPENPLARALKAAIDLRAGEHAAARDAAEAVLAEDPTILVAHMVAIAERMGTGDLDTALAHADRALDALPGEQGLHLARLAVLERRGDREGASAALAGMAALFPDDEDIARALVGWQLESGDAEAAEATLRGFAERLPDRSEGRLLVVRFLAETAGPAEARAELDRLVAAAGAAREDAFPYSRALAELDFAEGRTEAAIVALEALLEGRDASNATRDLAATLAGMLYESGRREEAARRAAEVLAADPTHVGALTLRAQGHLDADRPEAAIADLRAALVQAPRDPGVLMLMAEAHAREGARPLAAERLALAVESSGHAATPSLAYAALLVEDGRTGLAEEVIVHALRRAPDDPDLLAALGEIHLERGDPARARQVAALLAAAGTPDAIAAAAELEMAALGQQGRAEEALALLERHAEVSADARLRLVHARAAAGDLDGAGRALDDLLAAAPDDLAARLTAADLALLAGKTEAAEAGYRDAIALAPRRPEPHTALATFLFATGRAAEAEAALAAGIAATEAATPEGTGAGAVELRFARAGLLEAREDFEGAIAVYETLYADDPGNLVFANNLASLIATHRSDAESLERAHRIARRLQGSDVPHFQDTWGWILHRRGRSDEALAYLEPAARALGQDPLVQFHLGMTYLALDRREEAREALARAVAVAGEASTLPQIDEARARLTELAAGEGTTIEARDGSGG